MSNSYPLALKINLCDNERQKKLSIYSKEGSQTVLLEKLQTFSFEILLRAHSIIILTINFEFENNSTVSLSEALDCRNHNEIIWRASTNLKLNSFEKLKKMTIQLSNYESDENFLVLFFDEEFAVAHHYHQEPELRHSNDSISYHQESSGDFCIIDDTNNDHFHTSDDLSEISRMIPLNKQTDLLSNKMHLLGDIYDDFGNKLQYTDNYFPEKSKSNESIEFDFSKDDLINFQITFKIECALSPKEVIDIFKSELQQSIKIENSSHITKITCQKSFIVFLLDFYKWELKVSYNDASADACSKNIAFAIIVFVQKFKTFGMKPNFQKYLYNGKQTVKRILHPEKFSVLWNQLIFDRKPSLQSVKFPSNMHILCPLLREWISVDQFFIEEGSLVMSFPCFDKGNHPSGFIELKDISSFHYNNSRGDEGITILLSKEKIEYQLKFQNEDFMAFITKTLFHMDLKHNNDFNNLARINNVPENSCFFKDLLSRFRFSYRRNFSKIETSNYTSDAGWGCMIRAGQSLLAETLVRSHRCFEQDRIIGYFLDVPSVSSPFSIHNITKAATVFNVNIGDWFTPTILAKSISLIASYNFPERIPFQCAVIFNGVFEMEQLSESIQNPLLILIPLKLGIETINPIYFSFIKNLLSLRQCVGIIGGEPRRSMFIYGFFEDNLFLIDPHQTKDAIVDIKLIDHREFHPNAVSTMKIHGLDPSLLFGCYCSNRKEFSECIESLKKINQSASIFSFIYPSTL